MFVGKRLGFPRSILIDAESKAFGHTLPHPKWDFNRFISAQLLPYVQECRRKHTSHTQHVTQHTSVDRPHEHTTVNMSCIKTEEDCCVSSMLQFQLTHSSLLRNSFLEANSMHFDMPLH